jgi:membrane protein DedA with SNARE-associated domain
VPALLPPPAPFKVFVVAAGVFGYPLRKFVLVLSVARSVRFGFWAGLGVVFKDEAQPMLRAFDAWFARNFLAVGVVTAVLVVCWVAWRVRRSPAPAAD